MESYPNWIRLHPVAVDETLVTSVEARIHDPLWMLARQWQMGELRHDAGSTPINVRVTGTSAPITRLRGGSAAAGTSAAIKTRSVPLEALVEREAVAEDGMNGLRLRAEAGLQLLRMLRAAGVATSVQTWLDRAPFVLPEGAALDPMTREWWELVAGRVPDGARLRAAVTAALKAGAVPAVAADEAKVLRAWMSWHAARFQSPARGASTWNPERMEYAFAAGTRHATGEAVLGAPEYLEGRLEWHDFEQVHGTIGATGTLDLAGFNVTVGSLAGLAGGTLTNSATSGSVTFTTGGDDSSTVYAGVISNAAGSALSLVKAGIGTMIHYPVAPHLQPAYADLGAAKGTYPLSESIHDTVLSLPMGPHLDSAQVDYVIATLRSA